MSYYPFMGFWTGLVLAYRHNSNSVSNLQTYQKRENPCASKKHPLKCGDILDERYAKGELTQEQYAQIKEDLKKPT
jgi:uncharacterized membrane protein